MPLMELKGESIELPSPLHRAYARARIISHRLKGRSSMSKRVYKFTSGQYGIGNLQNKRLKLSTIDELNDPFDLSALDTTEPAIEAALDAVINHFRQTAAILCFTRAQRLQLGGPPVCHPGARSRVGRRRSARLRRGIQDNFAQQCAV